MKKTNKFSELIIISSIRISGFSSIIFVILILYFLLKEGLPTFKEVDLASLFGDRWYPIEEYFGLLPLLGGSIIVTIGAAIISIPVGIATAIYISEIAPRKMREVMKPLIELLAGLPSVLLGFLGILVLVPYLRETFNLSTGLVALTGSILLAGQAIPTIVSVSEDSLDAVPRSYRDAAIALGATEWQTIWHVTLKAGKNGVMTAIMLGIGRTFGETMAVMMVTGNAPVIPTNLNYLLSPVRTMTATIAAEMGEVASGSTHYHVLFFIGIILFLISLFINVIASAIIFRQRKRQERLLS
jgi:phosphate transport system permease protein